ncbi:MAG: class I SAM-dependent methyltransferase [Anaerolineae bacterium]|jgi:SAM-dependent methyltransferase|nr:class I SAM-dependent methyltransferase [Anaerolineae bacterium]
MNPQDQAALRGNPSFVWRAGQERRLAMVRQAHTLEGQRVLDVGCGVGMYTAAFARSGAQAFGVELEADRAREAHAQVPRIAQSVGETLPFNDRAFDVVFSHEVLEHVRDDSACAAEMVRVTRPGGAIVIFVPNRLYFFETHGIYWKGNYRFGNIPLVNWLPDRLRDRLAPHVRAYTRRGLRRLFADLPVRTVHHTLIYPGYDNIVTRRPQLGRALQAVTYALERTPLRLLGLSHFLVLQVTA